MKLEEQKRIVDLYLNIFTTAHAEVLRIHGHPEDSMSIKNKVLPRVEKIYEIITKKRSKFLQAPIKTSEFRMIDSSLSRQIYLLDDYIGKLNIAHASSRNEKAYKETLLSTNILYEKLKDEWDAFKDILSTIPAEDLDKYSLAA